jgi:hypothetical protein
MNTYHYFLDSATVNPVPDGALLAQDFLTQQIAAPPSLFSTHNECTTSDVGYTFLTAQWIHPLRYGLQFVLPAVTGTLTPPAATQNVGASISREGDLADRHNRGRVQIAGIPAADCNNGLISNAQQILLAAHAFLFKNRIPVTSGGLVCTFAPCIFNRADPAASAPLTQAFVMGTTRVMRRRTVGVGK